jgi:hypothetical protein
MPVWRPLRLTEVHVPGLEVILGKGGKMGCFGADASAQRHANQAFYKVQVLKLLLR